MTDLKALAEAAKVSSYVADTGEVFYQPHPLAEFRRACTVEGILALYAERDEAFRVIRETLWMAQRYATGRQSYAVGKYNDAARLAVKIGAVEAKRDGVLWALDGGNTAGLSGLTEAEFKAAIEYRDALSSAQEEVGRLRAVMRETSEYLQKLEGNMLENDADMMLDDCLPPSFHADQIDQALTKEPPHAG